MVTIEKINWEIRHLLKKISDDANYNDRAVMEAVHSYRHKFIDQLMAMNRLNPEWIQSFRNEPLTMVDSGDIPNFTGRTDLKFGKVEFPSIFFGSANGDGMIRMASSSSMTEFFETTLAKLKLMIDVNDLNLQSFRFFFRSGFSFYFYNYFSPINAELILGNPMDGWRYLTGRVITIEPGEEYEVRQGSVYYNGTQFSSYAGTGSKYFTGVDGIDSFTATGSVQPIVTFRNQKRKMRVTDPYPVDQGMAQDIILAILTKDFQINRNQILDAVNDAADSIEILKGMVGQLQQQS